MKKFVVALFVSSLAMFSSTVMAQDAIWDNLNYFGVTAGLVSGEYIRGSLDTVDKSSNHHSFSDLDLSRGYMFSIRLGRTTAPPKAFAAIELEGLMIGGTDVDDQYYYKHPFGTDITAEADISTKAIMLNVLLRAPFGKIHPYAGFGLGWAWFDMDMVLKMWPGWEWPAGPGMGTDTCRLDNVSDNTYAVQCLLGVELDLSDTLSFDLGYRYFRTQAEFAENVGTNDLNIKMTYRTHSIIVGLKFKF